MNVKYINHENREFNLKNATLRLKEANFHNSKWRYSSIAKQFGVEILRFEKDPAEYNLQVILKGSNIDRKLMLNSLHDAMDADKLNKRPGKIMWDESYISGYFISSKTYPAEGNNKTVNDLGFIAPYPFWITEQEIKVKPISEVAAVSEEAGLKTYPYTYPYRYPLLQTEINEYIDHYTDSDFKMIVYGPTTSVLINIAGHPYEVQYPLEAGEYMVIDSRPNTPREEKLYLVRTNGIKENIFDYRSAEYSVFKKIPPGNIKIDYARTYGVEIIIYKERSEPPWKL